MSALSGQCSPLLPPQRLSACPLSEVPSRTDLGRGVAPVDSAGRRQLIPTQSRRSHELSSRAVSCHRVSITTRTTNEGRRERWSGWASRSVCASLAVERLVRPSTSLLRAVFIHVTISVDSSRNFQRDCSVIKRFICDQLPI